MDSFNRLNSNLFNIYAFLINLLNLAPFCQVFSFFMLDLKICYHYTIIFLVKKKYFDEIYFSSNKIFYPKNGIISKLIG